MYGTETIWVHTPPHHSHLREVCANAGAQCLQAPASLPSQDPPTEPSIPQIPGTLGDILSRRSAPKGKKLAMKWGDGMVCEEEFTG